MYLNKSVHHISKHSSMHLCLSECVLSYILLLSVCRCHPDVDQFRTDRMYTVVWDTFTWQLLRTSMYHDICSTSQIYSVCLSVYLWIRPPTLVMIHRSNSDWLWLPVWLWSCHGAKLHNYYTDTQCSSASYCIHIYGLPRYPYSFMTI